MIALGFSNQWIQGIIFCVNIERYTLLLNGEEVGPIISNRGLYQGYPLSPCLFIICTENLSILFSEVERKGWIHSCKVKVSCLRVSYLFFC